MELSEFRAGILDDVHFNASMNGTSPREEFLALYAGTLVDAEEFEDFEQLAYEGVGSKNRRIQIDGYYYSELDNYLYLNFPHAKQPRFFENCTSQEINYQLACSRRCIDSGNLDMNFS